MRRPRTVVVAAAVALMVFAAACGSDDDGGDNASPTSVANTSPVKLGILIPQSGNAAVTGKFMTDGAVAAIKELNDNGGIKGRKIEYEVYDTVGDPQNGINAYNRWRSEGGKFAIIGFSAVVTAVGPMAEREDVLLVNGGAPPFDPTAMGANTIHTLNGQDLEMKCAAEYAYETLKSRNVGAIYADIAANKAGVDKFTAEFEKRGGTVAGKEGAPQGTPDFRSILTRLKSKTPDLMFVYTFGPDPGNIAKQMEELNFDAQLMAYSGAMVPQTADVGGSAAEGFLGLSGYFDATEGRPETKAFLDARKKHVDPNDDPSKLGFYHATLYDSVKLLAKAMEWAEDNGKSMDKPADVEQAFYEVKEFPAATGTATYTSGNPVPNKPFQVLRIKDGKLVPIDTLEC